MLCALIEFAAWRGAAGGRTGYVTIALAAAPFAAYLAYCRPMIFPYALFALLVPLDSLLAVGHDQTLTKLLGLATGAALLLWSLRRRTIVMPPAALIPIGALLAWMYCSLMWTPDYAAGHKDFRTLFEVALLFAVLAVAPIGRREFRIALWAIALGGVAAALYGIWVFHHPNVVEHQAQIANGRLVFRVGTNSLDTNLYADGLFLPLSILLVASLRTPFGWKKGLLLAGVATIVVAIYYSASREALLGCAAMLLFLFWKSPHRKQLLLPIGLMGGAFFLVPQMAARLSDAVQSGGAGRISIWKVAWKAFEAHPLFGTGTGSFATVYDEHFLQVYQSYDAGWSRASHNLFAHYGVESGIVGIVLVAAIWWAIARTVRVVGREHPLYDTQLMLWSALLALFIGAMFIDIFAEKVLWLAFGLVAQYRAMAIAEASRSR